ncbi:dTDP-4-dehydrorhamnose 3,5-epimerase [Spirochaeta lutea]|uniref:dTDP-4-dehydrorhamnose 3,5-epimerase n=1 Tax=Spirochaeta lutea TaxID=1480694 RepID=A0A098QTQ1_9SPIO|nr:dTDP-4-dehydrorhamnose 3,5-epimerase [Spirochaeta lutea]KGE71119.1 dTDP-4-dehydrorhamnose 3,5-epimerase [Spirochaeta lutea]
MPCTFTPGPIPGLVIIQPRVFADDRGWFMESYKKSEFIDHGISEDFVQDNHSRSIRGVLRGLHFQRSPHAQGKLVRCLDGRVWDVAVDLRRGSPTFGRYHGIELSPENSTMFYIPPGFAHGFITLSEHAEFVYKCTEEYAPESDGGVRWDDPDLALPWPLDQPLVSPKDSQLPFLADLGKDFAL